MKAIETIYNGYRFKSKLEAKWAVFFETLGMRYEYEPEAFAFRDGWYTPDFYIPEMYLYCSNVEGVYIEVKPIGIECPSDYWRKISLAMRGKNLVLFAGEPYDFAIPHWQSDGRGYRVNPEFDSHQTLAYCGECHALGVEYLELARRCCPQCDAMRPGIDLVNSATAARQHRFFHKVPA